MHHLPVVSFIKFNFSFIGQEEMLEIGLLNIDDRQYNIDNDDDSRVDDNGKRYNPSPTLNQMNYILKPFPFSLHTFTRIYRTNDRRLHE